VAAIGRAQRGDCRGALARLLESAGYVGHAVANARVSGGSRFSIVPASHALDAAQRVALDACTCSR
jgi:hypothetical protein